MCRTLNNTLLQFRRIQNDELQLYLNAADFVVLPYEQILTSGSAVLAFSFARPIIAPALGGLRDLVQDNVNGFLYDPLAEGALLGALKRAAATSNDDRAAMSDAALATAASLRWSLGRFKFANAIAQSCPGACRNSRSAGGRRVALV